MLFSVEQAFVGREEIRAPLKMPAGEATWEATFFRITKEGKRKFLRRDSLCRFNQLPQYFLPKFFPLHVIHFAP